MQTQAMIIPWFGTERSQARTGLLRSRPEFRQFLVYRTKSGQYAFYILRLLAGEDIASAWARYLNRSRLDMSVQVVRPFRELVATSDLVVGDIHLHDSLWARTPEVPRRGSFRLRWMGFDELVTQNSDGLLDPSVSILLSQGTVRSFLQGTPDPQAVV